MLVRAEMDRKASMVLLAQMAALMLWREHPNSKRRWVEAQEVLAGQTLATPAGLLFLGVAAAARVDISLARPAISLVAQAGNRGRHL